MEKSHSKAVSARHDVTTAISQVNK